LTKLWRLKLGGPVIIPHRVDLEVWCRHHSRPIRLSNFLVIILIIIVIIVGRCKVVCVCKCSCTRKQKPKVMESMTLRLCTEQQTRRLFMQRACVLLIWHLLLTLCFSECRTHQGHVQKLTGRIGRTIGTASVGQVSCWTTAGTSQHSRSVFNSSQSNRPDQNGGDCRQVYRSVYRLPAIAAILFYWIRTKVVQQLTCLT